MSFFSPGPFEVGMILLVVLIVFGPGRLPEVFRALGSGMRQFKEASNPELFVNSANPAPSVTTDSAPAKTETQEQPAAATTP